MSSANAGMGNLANIFVAPGKALQNLKEQPTVAVPILLLLGAWIVLWIWYYHAVDFPWLIDRMIQAQAKIAPPEQRARIVAATSQVSPTFLTVISIASVIIVLLLSTLIMSAYLLIVAVVREDDLGFKSWLSLVLWTSLPSLLVVVAIAIHVLLADQHRVAPDQLNPLSLDSLLFGGDSSARWKRLLGSLDLTSLWSWALLIFGYRLWTRRSVLQSAVVVLAPIVILYGGWAIMISRG